MSNCTAGTEGSWDVQMWGCADVQMWGCANEWMCRWEDVGMCRFGDAGCAFVFLLIRRRNPEGCDASKVPKIVIAGYKKG
jgi:hypothetical protein